MLISFTILAIFVFCILPLPNIPGLLIGLNFDKIQSTLSYKSQEYEYKNILSKIMLWSIKIKIENKFDSRWILKAMMFRPDPTFLWETGSGSHQNIRIRNPGFVQ